MPKPLLFLSVILIPALLVLACGDDEEAVEGTPTEEVTATEEGELFVDPDAPVVDVSFSEFKVDPSTDTGTAGGITFNASNDGTIEHNLYVFKSDLPVDQLPVEAGVVPEEGAAGAEFIGEIPSVQAGTSVAATFDLEAGEYALICNVPGHYEAGMHAAFTVE